MIKTDIKISFVIPLYNEESIFEILISRLDQFSATLRVPHEIILIDDGSSDNTPNLMETLSLKDTKYHSIFLSRNFGHQYAVTAGLMFSSGTDGVMILDGDLQDPPEIFNSFYQYLQEGYEVVYGIRTRRKEGRFKKMGYYFFYRLLSKISPTPVFIDSGDFSLLSRRVVDIINMMPENSRFLRGMRGWVGFKQRGVVYERDGRVGGEPKYTFAKLIKLAYDGIFNFSFFPIRFLTWSGVICLLSSVLYLIVTVYRKFFENDVPIGFTALLFIIIFFGGIQLISIGIIGEYVFRTFQQVKNRPMFIVKTRIEKGAIVNE